MTDKEVIDTSSFTTTLVQRSTVTPGLPYTEYKQNLRYDFYYSCAYCCVAESEAGGVRFTIDHYEPQKARADLVNVYDNLMWTCDECNRRKGDRTPPQSARDSGFRFFRPDYDVHLDHFALTGNILKSKTNTGYFTIESLDLNRDALQRVRDVRRRIYECDEAVAAGVLALSKFPIDRLPTNIRGPALRAIRQLVETQTTITRSLEDMLRDQAKSHMLDEDVSAEARAEVRRTKLQELEGLFPGQWRGPRKNSRK